MKKTLSILLSLLMVLGTMTCLFTMPVTTASAEEAATPKVETLPVNDFITNNGIKTINPDSVWTIETIPYSGAVAFGISGWNLKKDEEGNVISGQSDSYIDANIVHQMTFDVTVSDDANEGVKIFPEFFSQKTPQSMNMVVGVRSDKTTPNKVETAYNYVTGVPKGTAGAYTSKPENAATVEAGKTYTYTYLFNTTSDFVNFIAVVADGLTAGNVKISNAKIFPLNQTEAGKFYLQKGAIPYAVEEDGNVYTRMYGYRDIGATSNSKYAVSAKVGGDLYNVEFKGGNTYELSFDARYITDYTFNNTDAGRAPGFDFFETGAIDYNAEYNAVKAAAQTTETDTYTKYKKSDSSVNLQRTYIGSVNGYSYYWCSSGSEVVIRRVTANNVGKMEYYNADGTLIVSKSQGIGSQHGRDITDSRINTGAWMKGLYTLEAVGAQTLEQAAEVDAKYDANMRYAYSNGTWTFNSSCKNIYAAAAQDATVALSIEFIYAGSVYDFDNFAIKTKTVSVPVEYKNAKGEVNNSANTAHTASMYTDVLTGKTYADINLFENDALVFDGWYNGDELVSTDVDFVEEGTYNNLKAVIVNKNLLTNAGGFENYSGVTNLEADFVELKAGQEPYPNYTGSEARYYKSVPPTGDKWTGSDSNFKLSSIKDNDNGVTTAKIIADIKATGGVINDKGVSGFTYFKGFPTIVTGTQSVKIYGDAGTAYGQQNVPVVPYNGNKMLRLQTSSRTGFRALEGLTAGKTYTLSFYAYNPYAYYYLKEVVVTDGPMTTQRLSTVTTLASYTTPTDVVTEDIRDKDGNVTGTYTEINKAKPEYVQNWYKVELTFTANANTAYLGISNQNRDFTSGYAFIDELAVVEYDCKGNHVYDNVADTTCNACGEEKTFPSSWDFEDGSTGNITVSGNSTFKVVDAKDQAEKIGSKYLEYTSAGFDGMAFNFRYEKGYKYIVSYDFKVFEYGTGKISNGIDHALSVYDDGKYGGTALNKGTENIITRYWENGQAYQKVTSFSGSDGADNNFVGRVSKDGVYIDEISSLHGGKIWDEWQRTVVEIGTNNDYDGLVEYGIRPNDAGWVVGVDNFKVEKIALTTIEEADNATNGTYAFNIRARTADQKQGLRFKSTIDLDALNLADGAKIVEYGTLAMKAELLDQGFILDRQAAKDKANAGHVIAGIAYNAEDGTDVRYALDETTNTLTYTGVLTGIGVKNYEVGFAVRGYAIVELADGTRTTVYDDVVTLSVYDAALEIVEANQNAADVAVAQTVIDVYEAYIAA